MKVVATNIGEKRTVNWKGKEVVTGIFKYPVDQGIVLKETDVQSDAVVDRRYHGGIDKACYAYSADYYDYWKELYPDLDTEFGLLGENLTIEGLDEKELSIGDVYKVGDAVIEVAQPRQPCMKLNVRLSSGLGVKQFIAFGHSGVYFRVLKNGKVSAGDVLKLQKKGEPQLSVRDVFHMMYERGNDALREVAIRHDALAESAKMAL